MNEVEQMTISIVVSRFNERITKSLQEGCFKELIRLGVPTNLISTFWVPGALEIPLIVDQIAKQKEVDAIICLGCVIRGKTSHYDVVVLESAQSISKLSLRYELPILNGILTTENILQAEERCGIRGPNKGAYCAKAAIEMVHLLKNPSIKER